MVSLAGCVCRSSSTLPEAFARNGGDPLYVDSSRGFHARLFPLYVDSPSGLHMRLYVDSLPLVDSTRGFHGWQRLLIVGKCFYLDLLRRVPIRT